MAETIEEMAKRTPDRILTILDSEMKSNLWRAEEMWKEGVEEVVPYMVATKDKLKGLEELIKDWERINKKARKIAEEVL